MRAFITVLLQSDLVESNVVVGNLVEKESLQPSKHPN